MKRMVLYFMVCLGSVLSAESIQTLKLDNLNISNGLPNSSVSKIIQDDNGFMWIGTQSGLSRYDGYNFKTYLNDPFDSDSIPHNLVQTMYLDEDNIMWLGTYNGLSRMDLNNDTFKNFLCISDDDKTLSNDVVVSIEKDSRGRLWVGTLDGLNLFDEETGSFTKFYNDPKDEKSLPDNTVRSIFKDKNNNLWIGTYGGLSLWDEQNSCFINYLHAKNQSDSIPSNYIMDIVQSPYSDDVLLLGSWGGGISEFNTLTGKTITYEIPDKRVYSILVDKLNQVWLGTWGGGLILFSLGDGSFDQYKKGVFSNLSHDIIYSLYEDLSGVIWIGTNGGGIDKYVGWKNQYQFYMNYEDDPHSIPPGRIRSAFEDSKSRLWFSAVGKGLSLLNKTDGCFTNYTHDENDSDSLSNNTVNVIYEDSKKNLWIGTNNGINKYIDKTDSFEDYYIPDNEGDFRDNLPKNLIYSIVEDFENDLWFGTYTKGLSVLDGDTGEFRYYVNDKNDSSTISDNLIRSLYVDSLGELWIATNKGLNLYVRESDSFKRFLHDTNDRNTISSNDIRKIFEDSDGELWIGTNGGGINHFNRNSGIFTFISTDDGLLSNTILGIEEGKKGTLLFITHAGISLYNKKDKSFSVIDEKTGLLSSELSAGYLKASDGSYYIGCNRGITHVPLLEHQRAYQSKPLIKIINLSVQGIPYGDKHKPVWQMEEITLKHQQNILSFEFALSDYSSEGQNQFAYKLEGVDEKWVYSGVRNYARYTELSPGKYRFRLIGADSRNNWNSIGTTLQLVILPPFWLSSYAYVSYLLLMMLLIAFFILLHKKIDRENLLKIEEQKLLNLELEKRVRLRTSQIDEAREVAVKATKAKSLFLANMSHELRTPLNAIIGFSSLLNEEDYNSDKKHIISSIKTAGKSLSVLINDLLDLSKLEAGKITIKYTPINIRKVLFEVSHIFDLRMKEKKLDFQIIQDQTIPTELMLDETRFRQILLNLIGNAIKFTTEGFVRITVRTIPTPKKGCIDLQVIVIDSGKGISNQDKERLFELFWQSENKGFNKASVGTGLGLSITKNLVHMMNGEIKVQSEEGSGSSFIITFHDIYIASDFVASSTVDDSRTGEKNYLQEIQPVIIECETPDYIEVIDNKKIIDIEHLLTSLDDFTIEWKNLKPSGRMSILENFALRLRELGKRHHAKRLLVYAEDFLLSIKQFDLLNIEIKLREFPEIIEKIKEK